MMVQVQVSLGELVDKITILEIKKNNIKDEVKQKHIANELSVLRQTLTELGLNGIEKFENDLLAVNKTLWKIEDDIREKERSGEFDQGFIDLARAVYVTNDQRFAVKSACNEAFGSTLVEVKSYKDYKNE